MEALITADLIRLAAKVKDEQAAMAVLGAILIKNGYISEGYIKDVVKREKEFPTGITLAGSGIAIPHATPAGNVRQNGIAILQLAQPIVFHSMENAEDVVSVDIVFMLALKDSDQHIAMLQKLFGLFQMDRVMRILQNTTDKEELRNTVLENLK